MDPNKEAAKRRLEAELSGLRFDGADKVMARAFPRSWPERIRAIWNMEIEIPVVPGGTALAVLLLLFAGYQANGPNRGNDGLEGRQLVEAGGSTYWKDEFDKAVANAQNQNEG